MELPKPGARLIIDLGWLLYLGPIGHVPAHRCPATVVAVGLDEHFEITVQGHSQSLRAITTPAGTIRSLCSNATRVAVTLVDPGLKAQLAAEHTEAAVAVLERLWHGEGNEAWFDYRDLLGGERRGVGRGPRPVDERVRTVAQRIQAAGHDDKLGSAVLGMEVGLSASRLEHLFKRDLGVAMRAYRSWRRFQALARAMAAGADLTTAAHAAGFFDSAHMNHAFRQAFGIVPGFVFQPGLRVTVIKPAA